MFLKKLSLQNFRSFEKKNFEFSSQTTLIVGPNTSGKTNVLEAIFLLAAGKSFRARRETEMINYKKQLAWVKGLVENKNGESNKLAIALTTGEVQGKRTARKLYKLNGAGKRWRDFSGILKCVLFQPEDINLVLGSPSTRRDYLDMVLEQVDWQYRVCISAYKKALRQRNKLLAAVREGKAGKSQLLFWDQLLIKNGWIISQKREALVGFFNHYFQLERKTKGNGFGLNLEIIYGKSIISAERLEKYASAELALGLTLVGPHRDDLLINKKKEGLRRNLAWYGSRGEQRMAVLGLKLAELEFILKKTEEQPILLLDDIFSELDKRHCRLVLQAINSRQAIITNTEIPFKLDNCQIKSL